MKQGTTTQSILTAAVLGLGLIPAAAQHYPAGAEGIRAATLPPPGVYLRDYNFVFFAPEDRNPVRDLFAYQNAPRVIWITDIEILGANYGMDVIIPFGYTKVELAGFPGMGSIKESKFGLGDIQIEPLLLSWHLNRFDLAAGYAVWAPTGEFERSEILNLGQGFWTHMLTAGATWNINEEKTWALSFLNRYEISHEQKETHITPDQHWTVEGALSTVLAKGIELGVVGHWKQTTTGDSAHVAAAGPEISVAFPDLKAQLSLRYLRNFASHNSLEGNLVVATLTLPF